MGVIVDEIDLRNSRQTLRNESRLNSSDVQDASGNRARVAQHERILRSLTGTSVNLLGEESHNDDA